MEPSYWWAEDPEGVVSLVEGYNHLESAEHIFARRVNDTCARPIRLWYEALNIYRLAMQSQQVTRKDIDPRIVPLRIQLQAQGVASAKAALDMLSVGYYNVAFAAIRQLMDIHIQCYYLLIRPEDARFWATALDDASIVANPPSCRSMVTDLKRFAARNGDDVQFPTEASWQHLYDRWNALGSWTFAPAMEAEVGAFSGRSSTVESGPRHDSALVQMGFFYGLVTLDSLFAMLSEDGRLTGEGRDHHARYHDELDAWTASLRDELLDANDGKTSDSGDDGTEISPPEYSRNPFPRNDT